jgi:hypothetical protein
VFSDRSIAFGGLFVVLFFVWTLYRWILFVCYLWDPV